MATNSSRSRSRQTGAVAVDDRSRRRGGAGWLKWLLPLLLLAALAVLLVALLSGGDDKSATGGAGEAGTLSANGTTLHGSDPAALSGAIGRKATGTDVRVLSVERGSGFWVGSSQRDRTFVEWGSAAGGNENQSFVPKAGDHVNLTGPVQKAPADPAKLLHIGAADAKQVAREGAFVNADRVQPR
jgi:hypothetical protein